MHGRGHCRVITIPVGLELGAAVLWALAAALMVKGTLAGGDAHAWWALLVGLMAVSATGASLVRYHRRVILDVLAWELRARDGHPRFEGPPPLRVIE